jgi:hypothetical protein
MRVQDGVSQANWWGKLFLVAGAFLTLGFLGPSSKKAVKLFDGKTFSGWEGDTIKTWRIENGAIVGGSLDENVPHNEFLATKRSYGNFVLKLKFKLSGEVGFINAGVQFHSKRHTDPAYEMIGYQADLGKDYWGSLYDESRRNLTLVGPDSSLIKKVLKKNDWNDYEIRSENRLITLLINGKQTVRYYEQDASIPQSGLIALQIHGGGKAEVRYKDIVIKEL